VDLDDYWLQADAHTLLNAATSRAQRLSHGFA